MAFYMVTFTYPPNKAKEIGQTFLSKKNIKLPDYIKQVNVFVVMDNDVKSYIIYEVENDKTHNALIAIANRFTDYFDIEGSKFKIEPLLTTKEALNLIGLA
ncbi:MAG: hypothetical protein KGD57_00540 [Candidatus Lokiarchaeota archaeon]|nr:hypothetical protein [Candidatus Lokiarchaeota archaeon]